MRVASALSDFVPSSKHAHQLRKDMRDLLTALEKRKPSSAHNA